MGERWGGGKNGIKEEKGEGEISGEEPNEIKQSNLVILTLQYNTLLPNGAWWLSGSEHQALDVGNHGKMVRIPRDVMKGNLI